MADVRKENTHCVQMCLILEHRTEEGTQSRMAKEFQQLSPQIQAISQNVSGYSSLSLNISLQASLLLDLSV
jgi:hypothetical protein